MTSFQETGIISSSNSLADELNLAKVILEKQDMENEIESLKNKIANWEKNSKAVEFYRKKIDDMNQKRIEELAKLKSGILRLKPIHKQKCKFGWTCWKRAFCKFDHEYLYHKVNIIKHQTNPKTIETKNKHVLYL